MMYYFERGPFFVPVFWKENGIPFFIGGQRISKRVIAWWVPTNWLAVPILIILAPISLWRTRQRKTPTKREDG